MEDFFQEKRISDKDIYINEDRFNKPKEIHKEITKKISKYISSKKYKLLDCGCATGELLYLISKTYPNLELNGLEVSEELLNFARNKQPNIKFFKQDLIQPFDEWKETPKVDFVTCCGVLSVFDNYSLVLDNLISCTKNSGVIIVHSLFNPDPIDVIMRYKRDGKPWEGGWNILSKKTVESYLNNHDRVLKWQWSQFKLPFPIKKNKDDPMRSWTTLIESESTLVNGACQILYKSTLEINLI